MSVLPIDRNALLATAQADAELNYKLRGLTATIRIEMGDDRLDLKVVDGQTREIVAPASGGGVPDALIAGPAAFWEKALVALPPTGYENLVTSRIHGVRVEGDFKHLLAPYQGALQRLLVVLRHAASGRKQPEIQTTEPYRETDHSVGRYAFVQLGDQEARVYYEEAGTGPVPLVLQHTAGADSRQYRHVLANPEFQKRFRMIAWDLPYHGKSFPPSGVRWWEQHYTPTKETLMAWTVAISDRLGLERPVYMGCSVGGQLALDLAAHYRDKFRAFIALNGWYEIVSRGRYDNDIHRQPTTSTDYFASLILAATAPTAPQAHCQEVYWVYRSNFPGVYAGDNDYFMNQHDLRVDGHFIDAKATPVYAVTGEYDGSTQFPEHAGQAVARHIPGVIYRELPQLGHFAPADDPVRFCDSMLPILDEILARCGDTQKEKR
jgi:pimeloyl-ACP methyl ester carboxylesterase